MSYILENLMEIRNKIFEMYLSARGIKNFPECLYLEISNNCNLNCLMCPRQGMTRKKGVMEFNLCKKIIKEAINNNVKGIVLHVFGEPLIYPELLINLIDYIKSEKRDVNVGFSTNCLLLNKNNSKKILESGLDSITLSLDGTTSRTYSKLRRKSDYKRVIENIAYFLKLKKKMGREKPLVNLQIIKMDETVKELADFRKKWLPFLSRGDKITVKEYTTFAGQVEDRSIKSMKRLLKHHAKTLFPCRMLWSDLVVLWNGDVVACCLDVNGRLKLGNCKTKTLKEIVNGAGFKKMREIHLKGQFNKIPLCKACRE